MLKELLLINSSFYCAEDHCDKVENLRVDRETYPWGKKKIYKKFIMVRGSQQSIENTI